MLSASRLASLIDVLLEAASLVDASFDWSVLKLALVDTLVLFDADWLKLSERLWSALVESLVDKLSRLSIERLTLVLCSETLLKLSFVELLALELALLTLSDKVDLLSDALADAFLLASWLAASLVEIDWLKLSWLLRSSDNFEAALESVGFKSLKLADFD